MSHINILSKSSPSIEPRGSPEEKLLLFAHDYLNNLVVYLVNLCQDRRHVIWHSTNHDLSHEKPSKVS